jgi:2-dehydro-3-deoxyphosphogluconate aldolase/(4S)-4-hydroxy-2-oxoglutarate aldolase
MLTMSKSQVVQELKACGIVPVIRADSQDAAVRTAEALVRGGITTIEITMTVPDALGAMRSIAERLGNDALLGAGTVTSRAIALDALAAGARFLVTPCLIPDVITVAGERDVAVLPGALTPTEVFAAWSSGGDIVKVFPASAVGGPAYLRALKAPFPHIELCPTGGVNLDTISEFIKAGAALVGVGGELVLKSAIQAGQYDRITELARRYLDAVARSRS